MMATFDPTRTTLLRRKHLIDIRARMNRLKKWIQRWLVTDDMLGLGDKPRLTFNVVREFEFATSEQKLAAFRRHFENQINAGLLEVTNTGQPWTEQYVSSAYRKGQERAYFDVKKGTRAERLPFYAGSKTDFLRSSFFAPEAVSKVALLASRSFEELRGISAATSQQINRILADGLINGQGPATIAREMTKQIDTITSRRALTLARTEIIHAHAEGQLDSFERLGIETVSPQVEWLTAGDERVCVECDEFSGDVFTIDEARGMIPWHPNCRCAWTPVIGTRASKTEMVSPIKEDLSMTEAEKTQIVEIDKSIEAAKKQLDKTVGIDPRYEFQQKIADLRHAQAQIRGKVEDRLADSLVPTSKAQLTWEQSLTVEEQKAFKSYLTAAFDSGYHSTIRNIDAGLSTITDERAQVAKVLRGALARAPQSEAVVYRGITVADQEAFNVGTVIEQKTFASWTRTRQIASQYSTANTSVTKDIGIVFKAKTNVVDVSRLTPYTVQKEVFVDKGSKFIVKSIGQDPRYENIFYIELGQL